MGLQGAASITMACATFGLVAGSLIGGPIAERIIRRRGLAPESHSTDVLEGMESNTAAPDNKEKRVQSEEKTFRGYAKAVYILVLTMALVFVASKTSVQTDRLNAVSSRYYATEVEPDGEGQAAAEGEGGGMAPFLGERERRAARFRSA